MAQEFIPVGAPVLAGNEKSYVLDCLDSTWISSRGSYIQRFETAFADFCDAKYAQSCSNGTTALHLALLALGIGPGDEVIVPTLTFVATANAVNYCGGTPVFIDSEPRTWNMNPSLIEAKITPRTRAIIVVHLYGHPVDMDAIQDIARRHGLFLIEDAAEAHGARYKGKVVGSMGDISTFSFFGNKVLSTGEGGMVVTNDRELSRKVHLFKEQGMDPDRRYWHPVVGYNYRMTNIVAAIGLAQVEKADWHIQRRLEIAGRYRERLEGVAGLRTQVIEDWAFHVHQFFTVVLENELDVTREDVIADLARCGIEGRPVVFPTHLLPPYAHQASKGQYPVAELIASRGINLPTWAGLSGNDVDYICDAFLPAISEPSRKRIAV